MKNIFDHKVQKYKLKLNYYLKLKNMKGGNKFKNGDLVNIIGPRESMFKGKTGKIIQCDYDKNLFIVSIEWLNKQLMEIVFSDTELVHLTPPEMRVTQPETPDIYVSHKDY
jgi:hypothetical protein